MSVEVHIYEETRVPFDPQMWILRMAGKEFSIGQRLFVMLP